MTMTDPIADMLTRIRNANTAGHPTVEIPASKMKKSIAGILKEEGYIEDFEVIDDNKQGMIKVTMKYGPDKERVISGIRKISKPGLKSYAKANEIPKSSGWTGNRSYLHFQGSYQRQGSQKAGHRRRSNLLCMVGGYRNVKNRTKTDHSSCRRRGQS